VTTNGEPAQSLLNKLDPKDVIQMQSRAEILENKGLGTIVDEIWDSIPDKTP